MQWNGIVLEGNICLNCDFYIALHFLMWTSVIEKHNFVAITTIKTYNFSITHKYCNVLLSISKPTPTTDHCLQSASFSKFFLFKMLYIWNHERHNLLNLYFLSSGIYFKLICVVICVSGLFYFCWLNICLHGSLFITVYSFTYEASFQVLGVMNKVSMKILF